MIPIPGVHDGYGPVENHKVPAASRQRLSAQCVAILDLLRQGVTTNDDMSKVSRKYTSRVSDLRAAGYDVRCFSLDHKTGLAWYRFVAVNES